MSSDTNPPLDRWRFDAIATGKTEKLWGLPSIAEALGVSIDKARRLAKLADCPIYRPDGDSYFAARSELNAWLRTRK